MRDEVYEPLGFPIATKPSRGRLGAASAILGAFAAVALAAGAVAALVRRENPPRAEPIPVAKAEPAPTPETIAVLRSELIANKPSFPSGDRPSSPPAASSAPSEGASSAKVARKGDAGPSGPLIIDVAQALAAAKRDGALAEPWAPLQDLPAKAQQEPGPHNVPPAHGALR